MRIARSTAAFMLIVAAVALHADDWTSGKYTYNYSGEITAIGTDTFSYDRAGRLTSGTAGTGRKQEYSFDAFGNILTILTTDTNNTPKTFLAVDPATNRLVDSGDAYSGTVLDAQAAGGVVFFGEHDDRGNLVSTNGIEFFTYDDLNVMTTATTSGVEAFHVYGADDERVGSITVNGAAAGTAKWTFRDLDGKVLRSIVESADGTLAWDADYIYHGSALLAAAVPTRHKVLQYHLDHLGTPHMVTANGGVEVARFTYYPFGRDVPEQPLIDTGDLKFTGHQRDTATRDYMHARYYSVVAGRFLSADPGDDVDVTRPQSWNKYAYVRSNPINATDPTGMFSMTIAVTVSPLDAWGAFERWAYGFSAVQQLDRWSQQFEQRLWRTPQLTMHNEVRAARKEQPYSSYEECLLDVACIGIGDIPLMVGGLRNIQPGNLRHIFRSAEGHVNPRYATSMSRFGSLFEKVRSDPANRILVTDPRKVGAGVEMYVQSFRNGQVWVEVRGGRIINAGVNR